MQQDSECIGEIDWIEDAINKKLFKYYNYSDFTNFHELGYGAFGVVHRVNWKIFDQTYALKSFYKFDEATISEIVCEVVQV